jgi:hypothetical protein
MTLQKYRILKNLFIKIFLTTLIYIPCVHADNPCGVSCTETIALNAATNVLSQANAFTTASINTLSNRIYETVALYAENAANIAGAGATQWAFGDGDTGLIGIALAQLGTVCSEFSS